MRYSAFGLKLTETFEACRLASYQDQRGVWTIGFGHTQGVGPGQTCTEADAVAWLMQDIGSAEANVNACLTVEVTQPEFDALVDFDFNCGSHALITSTLLKLVNAGQFAAAADQFDLWDHCGGAVVAGLLRRREAERQEFLTTGGTSS